jgi:hypothetical protein
MLDCFALARNDGESRHCEERSDEAIQPSRTALLRLRAPASSLDCFAFGSQ